jgi:hypothetical protein
LDGDLDKPGSAAIGNFLEFEESRMGAVPTSAGRLPFKGIIHVAGINMLWRVSEWSIRQSVRNAIVLAH